MNCLSQDDLTELYWSRMSDQYGPAHCYICNATPSTIVILRVVPDFRPNKISRLPIFLIDLDPRQKIV